MSIRDDRLERLITRRLDGEMTEAESYELDKLVIRSREARQQLEAAQRQDDLVRSVLQELVSDAPAVVPSVERPRAPVYRIRVRRWPLPLAVAAAVVFLIGGPAYLGQVASKRPSLPAGGAASPEPVTVAGLPSVAAPVAGEIDPPEVPHYRRRALDRDVFGVVGEDGKTVYLLELNRERTGVVPVSGDL